MVLVFITLLFQCVIDFEIAVEIRFACVLDVKFLDRIGGGGDRKGRFYLFIYLFWLGI